MHRPRAASLGYPRAAPPEPSGRIPSRGQLQRQPQTTEGRGKPEAAKISTQRPASGTRNQRSDAGETIEGSRKPEAAKIGAQRSASGPQNQRSDAGETIDSGRKPEAPKIGAQRSASGPRNQRGDAGETTDGSRKPEAAKVSVQRSASGPRNQRSETGEIARLKLQNEKLRRQLAEADGAGPWAEALLSDLAQESCDERRIFCLKSELCQAVRRRRQLELAVLAGHEGLERLLGMMGDTWPSTEQVEQALADGASVLRSSRDDEAHALEAELLCHVRGRGRASNTPSGRGGSNSAPAVPPVPLTMEATFETEQLLFDTVQGLSASTRELLGDLVETLDNFIWQLLSNGANLPEPVALPQEGAAAARRQLRRLHLSRRRASRATEESATEEHARQSTISPSGGANFAGSATPVMLPHSLLASWRDALEAGAGEKVLKAEVEQVVAEMTETVASWATQLQAAHCQLSNNAAGQARQSRGRDA